jgi:hypothetical protein
VECSNRVRTRQRPRPGRERIAHRLEELKLVAADSADHIDDDHGDRAAARVEC